MMPKGYSAGSCAKLHSGAKGTKRASTRSSAQHADRRGSASSRQITKRRGPSGPFKYSLQVSSVWPSAESISGTVMFNSAASTSWRILDSGSLPGQTWSMSIDAPPAMKSRLFFFELGKPIPVECDERRGVAASSRILFQRIDLAGIGAIHPHPTSAQRVGRGCEFLLV